MRHILSIAAALCLAAATTSPASAQDNPALQPGARVRLITPRLEATQQLVKVLHVTSDSVEFRSEANPVLRRLAFADIGAIEVRAPGRRPFVRNALIGAGIGAVIGGAVGYATYEKRKPCNDIGCILTPSFDTSRSEEVAIQATLGGLVGTVAGIGIAAFKTGDRWTRIPLNADMALVPVRSGGFALTIKRSI